MLADFFSRITLSNRSTLSDSVQSEEVGLSPKVKFSEISAGRLSKSSSLTECEQSGVVGLSSTLKVSKILAEWLVNENCKDFSWSVNNMCRER